MKSAIVTGANGTLAPVLIETLESRGVAISKWDRAKVAPRDIDAVRAYLDDIKPDVICHLAMGDADWAGLLAKESAQRNIKLLFTSTAMVFHHFPNGPHYVNDARTAADDYGRGKIDCEDRILAMNPDAIVARIGWQIDWRRGGNNMFSHLLKTHEEQGFIDASEKWFPACSVMEDTCRVFLHLLEQNQGGVFQIDSNRSDKLSFADIVQRINNKLSLNWQLRTNQDYVHDQRLPDERIEIPNISNHL